MTLSPSSIVTQTRLDAAASFAARMQINASAVDALLAHRGITSASPKEHETATDRVLANTLCAFVVLDEIISLEADLKPDSPHPRRYAGVSGHPARIEALKKELTQALSAQPCWIDLSALRATTPGAKTSANLLSIAAERKQTALAEALIQAGSPLEQYDSLHDSPLNLALDSKNMTLLTALLLAGANPNTPVKEFIGPVRKYVTPLQKAVRMVLDYPKETVELLLGHGADPNATSADNPIPPLYLCRSGSAAASLIAYGASPIYYHPKALESFTFTYHSEFSEMVVKALLNGGADFVNKGFANTLYTKAQTKPFPFSQKQVNNLLGIIQERLDASAKRQNEMITQLKQAQENPDIPLPEVAAHDVILASNGGWLDVVLARPLWLNKTAEQKSEVLAQLPPWLAEFSLTFYPWTQPGFMENLARDSWAERAASRTGSTDRSR